LLDKFSEAEYYYANVAEDRGQVSSVPLPRPGRGRRGKENAAEGTELDRLRRPGRRGDPADCCRKAESCPCLPAAPEGAAAMAQLAGAMAFLASESEALEGEK